MSDQPQLFDAGGPVRGGGYRGRYRTLAKCAWPSCESQVPHGNRYCPAHKQGKVCHAEGCDQPARKERAAKYCEDHATSIAYQPRPMVLVACRRCGAGYQRARARGQMSPASLAWSELCTSCHRLSPISRQVMNSHHVPYDLAMAWLLAGDGLRCVFPGCGRTLTATRPYARPCIDHDHRCCGGGRSCGACIRGLVCPRCNSLIGAAEALMRQTTGAEVQGYVDGRALP